MSVGAFAELAHREIDALVAERGTVVVSGGTGLYLRAALADIGVPPPVAPELRARIAGEVDDDRDAAHRRLADLDPVAAEAVHPHDRKRLVRALELAETGESLVAGRDRLWHGATRRPTLVVGLDIAPTLLEQRIRERTETMFARGVVEEVRAAISGRRVSRTAEKTLGLEEIAGTGARGARARRRTHPSVRGVPTEVDASDPGSRPPRRRKAARGDRRRHRLSRARIASSTMRFEKWHALGNAYLLVEQPDAGELSAERIRRLCDVDIGIGSDGLLEVTGRAAARAAIRIWNPDGSTAELSGNGTRIAAAWLLRASGLQEVEIETESKIVALHARRSKRHGSPGSRQRVGGRRRGAGRRRRANDDRPGRRRQPARGGPTLRALARRPPPPRPSGSRRIRGSRAGRTSNLPHPSRGTSSPCSYGSEAPARRRRRGRRPSPSRQQRQREAGARARFACGCRAAISSSRSPRGGRLSKARPSRSARARQASDGVSRRCKPRLVVAGFVTNVAEHVRLVGVANVGGSNVEDRWSGEMWSKRSGPRPKESARG